jgi:hypothetical protein
MNLGTVAAQAHGAMRGWLVDGALGPCLLRLVREQAHIRAAPATFVADPHAGQAVVAEDINALPWIFDPRLALPCCRSGGSGLQNILLRRAARQRQPGREEKLASHGWHSVPAGSK